MNDYNEYRSYGSYLSRVFALIIAFALLVLAIWFVVRLASNNDGDDTLGDASDSSLVADGETPAVDQPGQTGDDEAVMSSDDDGETSSITTDDSSVDQSVADAEDAATTSIGSTSASSDSTSTSSEALPSTGAELWVILVAPALAFIGSKALIKEQ